MDNSSSLSKSVANTINNYTIQYKSTLFKEMKDKTRDGFLVLISNQSIVDL